MASVRLHAAVRFCRDPRAHADDPGVTEDGHPVTVRSVAEDVVSGGRRNSSPATRGMTIQIIVVEASIARSSPVFVA